MKLKRLAIIRLPGLPEGLTLEGFGDGLNVVTGPNASGKSSLIRALRHLIDPASDPGGALTLEAELASGEHTWTVTRSGSEIVWQLHGRRVDPPALPADDFLQCYWLSMDDLLAESQADREFARRLRRLLAGGFDLDAVRNAAPFSVSSRHGQPQQRELAAKQRDLDEIAARYEHLSRERERLPELEQRIRSAERAAARAEKTRRALEWLAARRARLEIERRLAAFPPQMDRLKGHEAERLDALENKRRELEMRRGSLGRSLDAARRELEGTGLAASPPDRAELKRLRNELEELRDAHTRLERLRSDLIDAKADEAVAAQALTADGAHGGSETDPATLRPVTPQAVERAVELAEKLRDAERAVRELEALAEVVPPSAETVAAHDTLARELRRWLRQVEPKAFTRLFGGGIAVLALGLGASLAALGRGVPSAAVLAGLAALAALAILAQLIALRGERASAERRAAELPLAPPDAWTPEAVWRRLHDVEKALAALLVENERASDAAARARSLDALRAERDALMAAKERLAREIGFDPAKTAESVLRFAQLAQAYDTARAKQHELRLEHADLLRRADERAKRIVECFVRYDAGASASGRDPAELRARLEVLESRAQAFADAEREIGSIEREIDDVDTELREIAVDLGRLYDDAGLARGDRDGLLGRAARFDDYRDQRNKLIQASAREQERRSGVADDDELAALVEADDEAALQALLGELTLAASTLERDRKSHAELVASLDYAGKDRALERAYQAVDAARGALRDAYDAAMIAEAGRFLIDDVADEHRAEREPEVVAAARERFARFTHDRYGLIVGDDGTLRARDHWHGTDHDLDTLSTGTRMQLLLAARLAWTAVAEQGRESLPIMLDEALTTSDPERFASIARNLHETAAREGRQVFYLSAEPTDALRFERAAGERLVHIDLAAIARGAPPAPERYVLAEPTPIPAPDGLAPEQYAARLRVPRIEPRLGAGAIHAFYLLRDDLELLHRLIADWHVAHVGPLDAMLRSRAASYIVPDPNDRARLAARCRIAHAWIDAALQGRGRPVERSALEASGAVSSRFIDEVAALAARLDGDAKRLVDALAQREVQGFHRQKADELGEWLEEHGYLDSAAVLTADERERETLLRAAGLAEPAEIRRVVASLEAGASLPAEARARPADTSERAEA